MDCSTVVGVIFVMNPTYRLEGIVKDKNGESDFEGPLSLILMLYLLLLPVGNLWQINLLMIPAELIVICCFKLRIKRVTEIFRPKQKTKNEDK